MQMWPVGSFPQDSGNLWELRTRTPVGVKGSELSPAPPNQRVNLIIMAIFIECYTMCQPVLSSLRALLFPFYR